jgi:predicted dehydrogenase
MRSGYGNACEEERLATKVVQSINEVINEGVQAAIVSSPATLHLEQSLELARNGVNLLIEKPISNTSDGVDKLLDILDKNNLVAMVGYVLRYDHGAIKFKKWLDDKVKGEVLHARIECGSYLPDWRPDQDYKSTVSALPELGGGVLLELSHELDYLHWFFGNPKDVQAQISNSGSLGINVEDQADLLITSEQGYCISVQIDFSRRHVERKCRVLTTEGELIWDAVNKSVKCKMVNEDDLHYEYNSERDYTYRTQLRAFIDCVDKNVSPVVNAKDGANVMKLINAAHDASKNGSKIIL